MSWCEQPFTGLGATSDSGGDVNGGDKNTCVGFIMSQALSLVLYMDICNNPHNSSER